MNTLLAIYAPTILASVLWAAGLALLGAQLAARDRAMQTLCVGQGAMLGVLLGLGLSLLLSESHFLGWLVPFTLAIVGAALTFMVSQWLVAHRTSSSNTHFASLFAFLLAAGYLVSAVFPALENHMAQKFFGDLATLSAQESWLTAGLGVLLSMLMLYFGRAFTAQAFEGAILNQNRRFGFRLFDLCALIGVCYSVQTVGFLFTVSCLFIPTSFVSRSRQAGLRHHLQGCALIAAVAAGFGFFLSLLFSQLPTVPTIVALMCLISLLSTGLDRLLAQRITKSAVSKLLPL